MPFSRLDRFTDRWESPDQSLVVGLTNTNILWDDGVADCRVPSWNLLGRSRATGCSMSAAGPGILTSALAERGSTVVGMDASEAYVAEARRHRSNPEVTYDLGDVRHLPYADSSFDACVSILVLDIIPEFDRVIREMRRVTRPGGVVASGVFDLWGGFSLPP